MANISMPLPTRISRNIKIDTEINQTTAKFGFGAEQTVAKGFRPLRYKISLQWEALTQSECDTVKAAIEQQISNPTDRIVYALPHESTNNRKWVVKAISYSYPDVGYTDISVDLREVYL